MRHHDPGIAIERVRSFVEWSPWSRRGPSQTRGPPWRLTGALSGRLCPVGATLAGSSKSQAVGRGGSIKNPSMGRVSGRRSGLPLVFCRAIPFGGSISLAHMDPGFRVAVVMSSGIVIDPRMRVDPHHGVRRAFCFGFGKKSRPSATPLQFPSLMMQSLGEPS
jgi:hypothetical protein